MYLIVPSDFPFISEVLLYCYWGNDMIVLMPRKQTGQIDELM